MRWSEGRTGIRLLVSLVAASTLLTAGLIAGVVQAAPEPVNEAPQDAGAAAAEPGSSTPAPERQVVLYYMHGARRCKTCRSIESYANGVVKSRFADELESGALTWKVVDFDKKENRHFVDDFGLFTSSLVVVETEQGDVVEFEVLQEAWSLVGDKTRFQQYVYRALREHLS